MFAEGASYSVIPSGRTEVKPYGASSTAITRVIVVVGEDGGVGSLHNRANERLRCGLRAPRGNHIDGGRDGRCFDWLVARKYRVLPALGGYCLLAGPCCCAQRT